MGSTSSWYVSPLRHHSPPTLRSSRRWQWLFSVVLLGLCATRLHYTIFLPPFDPLNNGKPFYDPIVVELVVTSVFALFWAPFV